MLPKFDQVASSCRLRSCLYAWHGSLPRSPSGDAACMEFDIPAFTRLSLLGKGRDSEGSTLALRRRVVNSCDASISSSFRVHNDTLASSARRGRVAAATLSGRVQTRFRLWPSPCSPSHRPRWNVQPVRFLAHIEWGRRRRWPGGPGWSAPSPSRTGRATFTASGSPSGGLDLCGSGTSAFPPSSSGSYIPPPAVRFVPHPSDCPPSPCGRLSRPRTTTRALPHVRRWPKAGLLRSRRAGRASQVRPGCVFMPS